MLAKEIIEIVSHPYLYDSHNPKYIEAFKLFCENIATISFDPYKQLIRKEIQNAAQRAVDDWYDNIYCKNRSNFAL